MSVSVLEVKSESREISISMFFGLNLSETVGVGCLLVRDFA